MVSAADIVCEQEEGLALLFQRGLELALRVQEDAMAAETPEERAKLEGAFHRISRGVRQTAALRARLAADARRAERDAAAEVVRLDRVRVARRKNQVKASVHRLIWTEAEDAEAIDGLKDELDEILDAEALDEGFAAESIEVQVARICATLGLTPSEPIAEAETAAECEAPPGAAEPTPPIAGGDTSALADDYWRSSA